MIRKISFSALQLATLLGMLVLGVVLVGCGNGKPTAASNGQKYHCPMHPTYISAKPGDCPICNMKLVPIKQDAGPKAATSNPLNQSAVTGTYTCPMHPEFSTNNPAALCPECNMRLKPKSIEDQPAGHAGADPSKTVPGRIAIAVSPEKRQLIGLTLSTVQTRELSRTIRTTATVEHDETRMARIAPRFGGWVRDLKINFTGQHIEKGEPLLTVYSPELLSAENEYLLAFRRHEELKKGPPDAPQLESARRLAESARRRLTLWQIGDEEITQLEKTGESKDALLLRSPVSGHVLAKTAVEGKAFMAGESLYEIGDLSRVWLRAAVPESDMPLIHTGQKGTVVLPYASGKKYESTVTFLYPHIEQQTRRAEVRLEVENPGHALRPGMWANVDIHAPMGTVLTIPASAVIDTGERFVAFVDKGDDHLEPRDVKIGAKTDDYYEVLDGVAEGEKVVTRALFLIDSESQLKSAISGMSGHYH